MREWRKAPKPKPPPVDSEAVAFREEAAALRLELSALRAEVAATSVELADFAEQLRARPHA